jgi:hypothetical protein
LEKPEGGDEDGPPSTDEDVGEKEADETDDEMSTTSEERGEAGGASSLPPGSRETENYAGYFEKQREARCAIHAARSEFARCQLPRLSRSFMFALVLARCVGCGLFA